MTSEPAAWRWTAPVADREQREILEARCWGAGALGVWERPGEVVAYFAVPQAPVPDGGTWEPEPHADWMAAWRASAQPVVAGAIAVVPTEHADTFQPPPGVRATVVLDSAQAFGTGHHATTAGCLEAVGDLASPGTSVLDVGTGSGILAIAAAMLGADPVVGVDIDAEAVATAERNAAHNGVALDLRVGSLDQVGGTWDLVLANLLTDTVTALAGALAGAVAPGGTLVVSGIGEERAERPLQALADHGLTLTSRHARDGWVVAVLSRPS